MGFSGRTVLLHGISVTYQNRAARLKKAKLHRLNHVHDNHAGRVPDTGTSDRSSPSSLDVVCTLLEGCFSTKIVVPSRCSVRTLLVRSSTGALTARRLVFQWGISCHRRVNEIHYSVQQVHKLRIDDSICVLASSKARYLQSSFTLRYSSSRDQFKLK